MSDDEARERLIFGLYEYALVAEAASDGLVAHYEGMVRLSPEDVAAGNLPHEALPYAFVLALASAYRHIKEGVKDLEGKHWMPASIQPAATAFMAAADELQFDVFRSLVEYDLAYVLGNGKFQNQLELDPEMAGGGFVSARTDTGVTVKASGQLFQLQPLQLQAEAIADAVVDWRRDSSA